MFAGNFFKSLKLITDVILYTRGRHRMKSLKYKSKFSNFFLIPACHIFDFKKFKNCNKKKIRNSRTDQNCTKKSLCLHSCI